MNGLYVEAGVSAKKSPKTKLKKAMVICGGFLLFFLVMLVSPMLMVLEFLYIGLAVYFFPRLSVDYEYIFCDGQVDFDKIMGNVKRKTVIKVDLDETEIVAPATSHVLDEYKNKNYKVKDFTSGLPECKPYVMISHYKEEYIKVYFEPSEKMVEAMRMKAPRKVFSY